MPRGLCFAIGIGLSLGISLLLTGKLTTLSVLGPLRSIFIGFIPAIWIFNAFRKDPSLAVCGCRENQEPPTPKYLRKTRGAVGVILSGIGLLLALSYLPLGLIFIWAGISHVVAALSLYPGCPEIGEIGNLVIKTSSIPAAAPGATMTGIKANYPQNR